MARIFTEGFEERYFDYQPWSADGLIPSGAAGRTANSQAVAIDNFESIQVPLAVFEDPTNLTEIYIRYALQGGAGGSNPIFQILSKRTGGPRAEVGFAWGQGNVINLYTYTDPSNPNTITLRGSGKTQREVNKWYLVEVYYKMGATTGEVTIKVEGSTEIQWTGNTIPQSGTGIYTVKLVSNLNHSIDDLAVNDTSGGADNSWVGDGRIIRLAPTSTSSAQWTRVGSGSNNHEVVDEMPPNTTDYVKSATNSDTDWYELENLPAFVDANDTIRRVWASAVALESTADADEFATNLEIGGTPGTWTNHVLTSQWKQYNGDPVTSPSQSDVNGMKVGIKVV